MPRARPSVRLHCPLWLPALGTRADDADVCPGGAGRVRVPVLEFGVLGPVVAVRNGRERGLGGPKQRAVLALLLVEAGRVAPEIGRASCRERVEISVGAG